MAALSATATTQRSIQGDCVFRVYTLSGTNGDTFAPQQQNLRSYTFTPTTNISVGMTLNASTNTLTFATGGAFAGILSVLSREG